MPTLAGSITIADLLDGVTGASVVLSNEAHTFSATADGEITDLSGFNSTATVFIGVTAVSFDPTGGILSTNDFDFGGTGNSDILRGSNITFTTGADLRALVSTTGVITIVDLGLSTVGFDDFGTAIDNVVISIPLRVNNAGTIQTYNRSISLTKARGGSAKIIQVSASRQTVTYAFSDDVPKTGQDAIVFLADFQNYDAADTAGVWRFRVGTTGAFTDVTSGTQGTISTDVDTNDTLTVSSTQYQTARGSVEQSVTYRMIRDTRLDQVTAIRLQDAEGGYQVFVETDESTVFRNNPTYDANDDATYADLNARIFRGGVEVLTGLTYAWVKDGQAFTLQVSQTGLGDGTNFGLTQPNVRIGAADVDDNKNNLFTCNITF